MRGVTMLEKRHQVLFTQLDTYRKEMLPGISEEEADMIPEGYSNNIRWNMGHVYLDQYLWIQSVTKEDTGVPADFHRWFGYGTSPGDFDNNTPSFKQLAALLEGQPQQIREKYGRRLEEEYAPTEMGMHTIEQVLIRTIFHEGLHLAAIMQLKRQIKRKTGSAHT